MNKNLQNLFADNRSISKKSAITNKTIGNKKIQEV